MKVKRVGSMTGATLSLGAYETAKGGSYVEVELEEGDTPEEAHAYAQDLALGFTQDDLEESAALLQKNREARDSGKYKS